MKKAIFLCCFFISSFFALGQKASVASFVGHWSGTLYWHQTGKGEPQKVKMQLIVRPTDTANVYTWQIIYGDKGQDNRPYLLRPVDTAKGHWQIDERNGIVIDQYFTGGRFASAFTVQTTTIMDAYWREGKNLVAEFYALSAAPVSTTGLGTDESPAVKSFSLKSYQRAVLKPVARRR
jgi:hypothetical protein